jgi:hypothetical protein
MATNPTVTETTPDLQPTTMDWTVVVKTTVDKDTGKTEQYFSSAQDMKETDIQKHKDNGTFVGTQTFGTAIPLTDAGYQQLLPDQEQRMTCAWNGMKSSLLGPRIRRLLEASKLDESGNIVPLFQFVDGIYDTLDLIREDAKRRNLSPEEKIIKNLSGIPGFENLSREALLGMYQLMKASLPAAMVADIESVGEPTEATA